MAFWNTKDRPPFLIGSRAYGEPRPDSDIDLVVCLTDPKVISILQEFGQTTKGIRFGMLNLIIVDPEKYDHLKEETQALISLRDKRGTPITREEAVKALSLSAYYGEDTGAMKGALSLPSESSGGVTLPEEDF